MGLAYIICANEEDIYKLKTLAEEKLKIDININNVSNIILEQRITHILHDLGISSNLKGYKLLKECITYYFLNKSVNNFNKDLYPAIAESNNISVKSLDKCISRVIEKGLLNADYELVDKLFGSSIDIDKGKPTNKSFIMTIVEAININIDFKV